MAGSDVKASHLHGSGFFYKGRARLRALDVVGTAAAGYLVLFDTDVPPVAATYTRSGTAVTITKASHGLTTGDIVGVSFQADSGPVATSGNFAITVTGADTFTLQDINTGTIDSADCLYVASYTDGISAHWITTFHTSAGDTYYNGFSVPDEGMLARKGIYGHAEALDSINVYFN